jgi:hypothetical protein
MSTLDLDFWRNPKRNMNNEMYSIREMLGPLAASSSTREIILDDGVKILIDVD